MILLFQCQEEVNLFEPDGFIGFMKRQFHSVDYALKEGEHVGNNFCQDPFSTRHHILPRGYLFKKLMLSFYEHIQTNYGDNENEDGNDPETIKFIDELNEEIKFHNKKKAINIRYDNGRALPEFAQLFVWTRSNLVCGPKEDVRKDPVGPNFDGFILPNDRTKLLFLPYSKIFYCEKNMIELFGLDQQSQRNYIDSLLPRIIRNCTLIQTPELRTIGKKLQNYKLSDNNETKDRKIENIKQLYLNYNTLQKAIEFLRGIKRIPAQITCEWRRYNKKFIAQNCYNAKRSFFK